MIRFTQNNLTTNIMHILYVTDRSNLSPAPWALLALTRLLLRVGVLVSSSPALACFEFLDETLNELDGKTFSPLTEDVVFHMLPRELTVKRKPVKSYAHAVQIASHAAFAGMGLSSGAEECWIVMSVPLCEVWGEFEEFTQALKAVLESANKRLRVKMVWLDTSSLCESQSWVVEERAGWTRKVDEAVRGFGANKAFFMECEELAFVEELNLDEFSLVREERFVVEEKTSENKKSKKKTSSSEPPRPAVQPLFDMRYNREDKSLRLSSDVKGEEILGFIVSEQRYLLDTLPVECVRRGHCGTIRAGDFVTSKLFDVWMECCAWVLFYLHECSYALVPVTYGVARLFALDDEDLNDKVDLSSSRWRNDENERIESFFHLREAQEEKNPFDLFSCAWKRPDISYIQETSLVEGLLIVPSLLDEEEEKNRDTEENKEYIEWLQALTDESEGGGVSNKVDSPGVGETYVDENARMGEAQHDDAHVVAHAPSIELFASTEQAVKAILQAIDRCVEVACELGNETFEILLKHGVASNRTVAVKKVRDQVVEDLVKKKLYDFAVIVWLRFYGHVTFGGEPDMKNVRKWLQIISVKWMRDPSKFQNFVNVVCKNECQNHGDEIMRNVIKSCSNDASPVRVNPTAPNAATACAAVPPLIFMRPPLTTAPSIFCASPTAIKANTPLNKKTNMGAPPFSSTRVPPSVLLQRRAQSLPMFSEPLPPRMSSILSRAPTFPPPPDHTTPTTTRPLDVLKRSRVDVSPTESSPGGKGYDPAVGRRPHLQLQIWNTPETEVSSLPRIPMFKGKKPMLSHFSQSLANPASHFRLVTQRSNMLPPLKTLVVPAACTLTPDARDDVGVMPTPSAVRLVALLANPVEVQPTPALWDGTFLPLAGREVHVPLGESMKRDVAAGKSRKVLFNTPSSGRKKQKE